MILPPITEFIATLKDAGYVLRVDNERLKVIHPSRPLDNTARQFIRENKPSIIQALQESPILHTPEGLDTRRQRGSSPRPSQAVGIPRAESLQAVGEVLARLGAIWPDGLEPDPQWQAKVGEAERAGNREAFHSVIEDWEASETRQVETYMSTIRETVAGWPDEYRRRFALMVQGFRDGNRGMGIRVCGLNPNAAMDKAYRELLPYVPGKGRDTASPATAPADDFPFTDLHPRTREILLRHWHAWGADRRQRFEKSVRDVMKETGYKEGNAAAFVFEKWRKR